MGRQGADEAVARTGGVDRDDPGCRNRDLGIALDDQCAIGTERDHHDRWARDGACLLCGGSAGDEWSRDHIEFGFIDHEHVDRFE